MPASALAEGQISELADVRASATVPVIDVAVSLSPEADGGLLMDNADASAGIDVNHLSEMGSITGEVSFDNNSNTSVRLARIESDATSLNSYFTGTSGDIASFKLGSYDELSWSPTAGAKTVYELTASDAADPSAGMVVPLGGASSATLSLDVSGLSATSSAREAAKDPASARDLMSLTWVFEAAHGEFEKDGGIRDQIAAITPGALDLVEIDGWTFRVAEKRVNDGHEYALMFSTMSYGSWEGPDGTSESNLTTFLRALASGAELFYETEMPSVRPYVVTPRQCGDDRWGIQGWNSNWTLNDYFNVMDYHCFAPRMDHTKRLIGNGSDYLFDHLSSAFLSPTDSSRTWIRTGATCELSTGKSIYHAWTLNSNGTSSVFGPSRIYGIRPMFWVQLD